MVDLAHAAPPEFGADALLRLVESGKIVGRDAQRDLVEQAFGLAVSAKFPVRKRHLPGTTLDSRAGSLSQAYGMKLDALSLQSRAVSDMVRIDPAEARKLIQEIPPPVFDAALLRRRAVLRCLGFLPGLDRRGQRQLHARRNEPRRNTSISCWATSAK